MKRINIAKLFLYRHRFVIGYVVLGIAFTVMLFTMPLIAAKGLSEAEMESATSSYALGRAGILNGDLVDLPYRLLQKLSIMIFGLTAYAIKLPSIIIGLLLGILIVLLLNRWFKNNVSLLASTLVILSTPFLFLAGSGTPLIMLVFWPTLLLFLGSKIQGEKKPKPLYSFLFAIILLLAIFTPYMLYFAVFCVFFVLFQPHLRFIVRKLPKIPLILVFLIIVGGIGALIFSIIQHPETIMELLFAQDFELAQFFPNIGTGLTLTFSWHQTVESVFLSPLISLPIFALALIGLLSTTKGFFASRNSIATILLIFCLMITGFNSDAIVLLILPFAILTAHGLKYLLEKWYGLFPENPYARISALLPLTLLFALIIIPGALQYIYGYRYNPNVANAFSDNLAIIRENLNDEVLIATEDYEFYKVLEASTGIKVASSEEEARELIENTENGTKNDEDVAENVSENEEKQTASLAFLGKPETAPENYTLAKIITSPKRENSDIIYIYSLVEGE